MLGLPTLSKLQLTTHYQVCMFHHYPLDREMLQMCFSVPDSELDTLESMPRSVRTCANAAIGALAGGPGFAVQGTQGFRAQLQLAFQHIWQLSQTTEELAGAGCPWLLLPDVGVLDLATCWNALRDTGHQHSLIPAGHPLRCVLETPLMIAILVAAPDGTPVFSSNVQKDVSALSAVISDDSIFDAPCKHMVVLNNCTSPAQLFDQLKLLRVVGPF